MTLAFYLFDIVQLKLGQHDLSQPKAHHGKNKTPVLGSCVPVVWV